jgi:hypothetical protein
MVLAPIGVALYGVKRFTEFLLLYIILPIGDQEL